MGEIFDFEEEKNWQLFLRFLAFNDISLDELSNWQRAILKQHLRLKGSDVNAVEDGRV